MNYVLDGFQVLGIAFGALLLLAAIDALWRKIRGDRGNRFSSDPDVIEDALAKRVHYYMGPDAATLDENGNNIFVMCRLDRCLWKHSAGHSEYTIYSTKHANFLLTQNEQDVICGKPKEVIRRLRDRAGAEIAFEVANLLRWEVKIIEK